jgi:heme/copper-type cytochrome/quinol oxidase subunit 2
MTTDFEDEIKCIEGKKNRTILLLVVLFLISILISFMLPNNTSILGVDRYSNDPFQWAHSLDIEQPTNLIHIIIVYIPSIITLIIALNVVETAKSKKKQRLSSLYHSLAITVDDQDSNIGKILLDKNTTLTIKWSKKGYFEFIIDDKVISSAKSSELYWKILYFVHKLKN